MAGLHCRTECGVEPTERVLAIAETAEGATAMKTGLHHLYAKGRLKSGEMNPTERRYHEQLEGWKLSGSVAWFRFEGITLKLAEGSRYTPDFAVMLTDGTLECHEVKSIWLGDAKTKIKVASALFPIRFKAVYAVPKKQGGGWRVEEF
jgi:hypothetical protein